MTKLKSFIPVFSILIFVSFFLNFGCKTSDEIGPTPIRPQGVFEVHDLAGSGIYAGLVTDQTTLSFSVLISSKDNVGGTITAWKFIVKCFCYKILKEVDHINYNHSYSNLSVYTTNGNLGIPANQTFKLEVKHDPGNYCAGEIFFGEYADPVNLEFQVTIMDNNGHQQTITKNASFDYTEY